MSYDVVTGSFEELEYTVRTYSYLIIMRALVATLYEDGTPVPIHRAVTKQPSHYGELVLHEQHDRAFRRSVRTARLVMPSTGDNVLPPLRDAVVIWIGDKAMTITGFSQDDSTRRCTGQTWYVETIPAPSGEGQVGHDGDAFRDRVNGDRGPQP